jgi:hypothetical protein
VADDSDIYRLQNLRPMRVQDDGSRIGTTAEWALLPNLIPAPGQECKNLDTEDVRIGDGVTKYSSLAPAGSATYVPQPADEGTVGQVPVVSSVDPLVMEWGSGGGGGGSTPLAEKNAWTTATAYAVNDVVTQAGLRYVCRSAHTSGTFSADLAANRWVAIDLTPLPSGSPAVGKALVVTGTGPLALGYGDISSSGVGVKRNFGAVGDMVVLTDATVAAGDATVTRASGSWTSADIGKTIAIPYAGANNGVAVVRQTHMSTIASVNSPTSIEMATPAVNAVTGPRTLTDVAINNNSTNCDSASANWTQADVGKRIVIPSAGRPRSNGQSADLTTWIVSVTSATRVVVSVAARATVTGRTVAVPGAWVGYGTDDTAAFQAASAAKGSIEIEPGRYLTTSEITVGSDTTWWGYGAGRSIVNLCGTGGSTFRYNGGQSNLNTIRNVSFRDFEVDGNGVRVHTYDSVNKGLYLTNVVNMSVERMYIHDTSATAVGCDFLPDGYMVGNVIERGGAQVPEFGGGAGGSGFGIGTGFFTVENVYIGGNTVRWCGNNGIFTESQSGTIRSRGVRIVGNYVEDCGFGISDRACDGTVIADNIVVSGLPGATPIYVAQGFTPGLYSINTLITNNVIHADATNGITTVTREGDLTIRGNEIRGAGQAAIRVTNATGGTLGTLTVEDNLCADMTGTARGIFVDSAQTWDRIIIQRNRVRNPGASATTRPGIVSGASCAAMYVRDNILWDTRGGSAGMSYGLQLTAGTITRLVYDGNDTVGAVTAQQDLSGATIGTTVTNSNP